MNTKFELPEGKWLVTIKNGQTKIKSMDGYITFKEESFLKIKSAVNDASNAINKVKSLI